MRLSRTLSIGVLFFAVPSVSWATTWNVAQAACDDTSCTPCCTIQGAVEHSVGGDVISVAPGTYPENVDFQDMSSVGQITLEAASGPGTVLVSPAAGHTLRHGGGTHDLVTIDGIDFSSGPGSACVYLDHAGGAVLRDIDASNCGYTAFLLDNTGNITMRRCTANSNARHGIQIDGASGAFLEDCTTNSNTMDGVLIINVDASVELVNPTAVGNTNHGLDFDLAGPLIITGATATNNGGRGIWAWSTNIIYVQSSVVQGNGEVGIDLEWNGVDPVDLVSLSNTTVSGNGIVANDPGVRLREISGPVTVTNCAFDNNGIDGLSVESSVVGDLEIVGGSADGNADDGFDLRHVGNLTATGVRASGNASKGFAVDSQAVVEFENCVANDNMNESGFTVDWQDPETVDAVTFSGCTANGNGLTGVGEGIHVRHVAGPVLVAGSTTSGNSSSGIRVQDSFGAVLVRDNLTSLNLEGGIEIDLDGQLIVVDNDVNDNNLGGLTISEASVEVASLSIRRNAFTANAGTGISLSGLSGTGTMNALCNDIDGNDFGMYLDSPATVDARKVWWGDATGPGGSGPGLGDGVFAEPGGTIDYSSWQPESVFSATTSCEFFGSGFETGLLGEWDVVVD
jgi:hypothetical protein